MKKLIVLITITLSSCIETKGDYNWIIVLKDSTLVPASGVLKSGYNLTVIPPFNEGRSYHIYAKDFIEAKFIGNHNIYKQDTNLIFKDYENRKAQRNRDQRYSR